ncbi:hypothetical protein QAD02_010406 [Eretmocerus hayati]|uniref:Uncharacterized protein n=1 Tax=Eretmocerus hayati TaxID=131215 RepID=A0ACC2NTM2_9HYME|nr:hypothetical protein QAD02_010406 [Eretmocerus hayati]
MSTTNKRSLETPVDIGNITPYLPNLFVKARVTSKTSLKEWSKHSNNTERKGQLFSIQLLDSSGEIRMTFFAEECKKFYEKIEVGKVYDIRNASVKKALKKYNDIDHKYELNATKNTLVDHDDSTPAKSMKMSFNFQDLRTLLEATEQNCTDVIVIVKDMEEITEIYSREKNEMYKRRDIDIIDHTNTMVSLSLWGDHAIHFSGKVGQVIVLKRAKLNVYQEIVKLSTTNSTLIIYDYEGKEKKT